MSDAGGAAKYQSSLPTYRWFLYALAGLGFGVFDWYYLEFLIRFDWPRTLFTTVIAVSLEWGIWLVPALPLAIAEVQRSQRIRAHIR